jgi:toxin ParE1/3/4
MPIRILAEAEAEIREAILHYEERQRGLGADLYERIETGIRSLAETPGRFPIYDGKRLVREFRRVLMDRFPYLIIYEERTEETLIVAFAHTSREPGYWDSRGT